MRYDRDDDMVITARGMISRIDMSAGFDGRACDGV